MAVRCKEKMTHSSDKYCEAFSGCVRKPCRVGEATCTLLHRRRRPGRKGFGEGIFASQREHFGPKRKQGARRMRESDAPFYTLLRHVGRPGFIERLLKQSLKQCLNCSADCLRVTMNECDVSLEDSFGVLSAACVC
jgi:hypothetical protein